MVLIKLIVIDYVISSKICQLLPTLGILHPSGPDLISGY